MIRVVRVVKFIHIHDLSTHINPTSVAFLIYSFILFAWLGAAFFLMCSQSELYTVYIHTHVFVLGNEAQWFCVHILIFVYLQRPIVCLTKDLEDRETKLLYPEFVTDSARLQYLQVHPVTPLSAGYGEYNHHCYTTKLKKAKHFFPCH